MKTLIKKLSINRMARVDSSVISYMQYNKLNKKLIICFNSGTVYLYSRVSNKFAGYLFGAHENGFSIGHVFNAIIKDNQDVCGIMFTGAGKSLCYQFPPVFTKKSRRT